MEKIRGCHFINGGWVEGGGKVFHSYNPASGETVWQGKSAVADDVDAAVTAARAAQKRWGKLAIKERAAYLLHFKQLLLSEKERLVEALAQENGKPLWEAHSEIASMAAKIDISIDAQQQRCGSQIKEQGPYKLQIQARPWGVAAVLGPFNFPGHLPNGHIVPALLAGNSVIFKPSELTPRFGEKVAELWEEAELPAGIFNMVQGDSSAGQLLAFHSEIDALMFTGSLSVGKLLASHFGSYPEKILALEMGGNNPLIVGKIEDAPAAAAAAAYAIIQSAFLSSGQRCSCCRRLILIENGGADKILDKLISMARSVVIGAYNDIPQPFMGPLINEAAAAKVLAKFNSLVERGGNPLLAMKQLERGKAFLSPGIVDVTKIAKREDGEIFGPLLQVIHVPDLQSALDEANNTQYGLTAGLLSCDVQEYELFSQEIRAGVVNWNAPLTGASSAAPFGGVGLSGNGRPSAYYAADYCNYPVASLLAAKLALPENLTPGIGNCS